MESSTTSATKLQRGTSKPSHDEPRTTAPRLRKDLAAGQHPVGAYSRLIDRGALGALSGNTREGRFLRAYERALLEHVGNPSITQKALIARTARLALHLELLDEKSLGAGRALTPTDCHFYGVWANSLARHLDKLGLKPTATAKPSLSQYLATLADEAAA
jgi:hypothetical protein